MHGLINKSIQSFLRDTYGPDLWSGLANDCGVGPHGFEAMLSYDVNLPDLLVGQAAQRLNKPREALLEDYGTYLASFEPLRRLLRFAGLDYPDFLQSLDELPGRARMAVSDLILPDIELRQGAEGRYTLVLRDGWRGFSHVLAGILRTMADDYGALAVIDVAPDGSGVHVNLLEERFAVGREFRLSAEVR